MDTTAPSYPVSMTDHDLLIRVDQRLSQLQASVDKSNDGLTQRVAVLEGKIVAYDQVLAEFPPSKGMEQLNKNTTWINNFQLTWRLFLAMCIGFSSVVTFILVIVSNAFHLIGFLNK